LKGLKPGILVERVFMEEIIVPTEIVKDLSSVARERRIAEATIISTKGDVESAKLMKESADLLDTKAAMQIRYL
jgi:erythrocyte band 7 integral membrane protein